MCRRLGVNRTEVITAAATKPFGFMPCYPGPGIGGHCIPGDPLSLSWRMRADGYEPRFIALADEINRGVGDTRESPAYEVIGALRRRGAAVAYADPHVPTFRIGELDLKAVEPSEEAFQEADCVVGASHPEFGGIRQAIPLGASGSARVVRL
jgi:UDP-N-acetyl-D-glucosamine dehydrogenase